ncbi:MAG: cobalamin biosynthesis protein [Acetobacteraceae bacterium]
MSDVAQALSHHGFEAGRRAVTRIVGRDVRALDESGVARAAIESLAENFSDGVIAPLFWFLMAGLPGLAPLCACLCPLCHDNWIAMHRRHTLNMPAPRSEPSMGSKLVK